MWNSFVPSESGAGKRLSTAEAPGGQCVTVESMARLTVLSLWLPLYGCVTGKRH